MAVPTYVVQCHVRIFIFSRILDRMIYAVRSGTGAVSRPYISFFLYTYLIGCQMMQYAVRGTGWNWSGVTGMVRDLQGHCTSKLQGRGNGSSSVSLVLVFISSLVCV